MVSLKPLTLTQISIIQSLSREIWQEHYSKILSQGQIDYMLDLFYSEERILQELEEGVMWEMLWNDNQVIGFLVCRLETEKLYLSKIYLKAGQRGSGYGKFLIDHAVQLALQNQKKAVYLNVNKYNTSSIAFYEKCGFKKLREEVNDIGNGYVMDDFVFEKEI